MTIDLTPFATPLVDQTLHALVVHRMLTTDQLARMFSPDARSDTSTRKRLKQLRDEHLVEAVSIRGPKGATINVWMPTSVGVDRALEDPDLHRRHVPKRPGAHRSLVAHTLAVNEVGLAFIGAAREHGHECDVLAWEHEVAHSTSTNRQARRLIADAVLSYAKPTSHGVVLAQRFIELDRATEPIHAVVDKIRAYAAYRDYRPTGAAARDGDMPYWQQRYSTFPAVCVIIGANPAKSVNSVDRRIETVGSFIEQDPRLSQLKVLFARFDELVTQGPLEAVWWRPGHHERVGFFG